MGTMRFGMAETLGEFRAIETEWRALETRAMPTSVYATFDWVTMSWPQSETPPAIAMVWDGERLVLGLPLCRVAGPNGQSHFAGLSGAMIQLVDALIDRDTDADKAIATLFVGLRVAGGKSLALWGIPVDAPMGRQVPMSEDAVTGRPAQVEMPDGFELYFAQRSHEMRSRHGRMMRRLNATVRVASSASWEADLDWFLSTKRAWTPPGGEPLRPWVVSPLARDGLVILGRQWADDGRAVLTLLETGGERIAGCLNFRLGSVATFYATTYAAAHAKYSPGLTLLIETLRVLAGMGATRVDLMQYPAAYKERMKTSTAVLRSMTIDLAGYSPDGSP